MAFDDGVKTVSGSIAHTDDAATKVPFVSVKCGIEPTLSGVSEVSATQTGENLFDKAAVIDNTWIVVNDTTTESAVGYRTSGYIPVKANTKYFVSAKSSNRSAYYDRNKNGIAYFSFSGGASFTCLYDGYIRITIKNDVDLDTFIVNEGNTAIPYEPYNGTTYTASLGRTIYGGQADIVNGVGESGCIRVKFSDLTWNTSLLNGVQQFYALLENTAIPTNNRTILDGLLCAEYTVTYADEVYVDTTVGNKLSVNTSKYLQLRDFSVSTLEAFKEKTKDYYLVYPLATPTDFTFTPITPTPETVGKVNNVYCNTGNTEVTYYDNAHGFAEVTVNRTGRNLFDKSKAVFGSINASTGGDINSSTRLRSTWIKLNDSTQYTLSTNDNTLQVYEVYQYTANKTKIRSDRADAQSYTFTTTATTVYMRVIFRHADNSAPTLSELDNTQLELGSTAHAYEPYEVVSKTAYLHKVIYGGTADVVKGTCEPKNLFDDSTFPRTATENNTYYASFQSILAEGNKYKIPTIHIEPDVAYVLSFDVECNTEPFNASVGIGTGYYSKDIASVNNNTSGRISVPFTLTSALKEQYGDILSFRVPRYSSTREFTFTISNVQLEKASSASEYVPHFEPFSFPPISMSTDEGENTLFANEGDSAITYRKAVD